MKMFLLVSSILILLAPVATWAIYKPARVLAPQWVENVSCVSSTVCIDDESRYREAYMLYEHALQFVAREVGPVQLNPRVIFCSTEDCFRSFGFHDSSASIIGRSGIIISPRGWKDYYVSHEVIHYRQAEELGIFARWLYPRWFIEGMAYCLSDDPRQALARPWQQDRARFEEWYGKVDKDGLWDAAGELSGLRRRLAIMQL